MVYFCVKYIMLSEYFDKLGTCNFSEAFDEIFEQISYSTPTQEEQITLRKLLEINADIRDKEFINDLSLIFNTRALVPIIREASRYKQFKNSFDIVNAFRILKNLYDSLEDKEDTRNIKDFIFYLLFEPIAQLREHVAKLKSLGFQPLKDTLKSLLSTIDFKLFNGETPCPLSYICSVSTNIHELFRPEYKEAEFVKYLPDIDSIGRDYFELMIESAYTSVNEITIQQGSGSMFDKGRNERNIDIINKLSPHWSHIMTTSATASSFKKQLKNIQNDIAVNVNDGLDIFLGDYEKINNINVGSKINNEAYNASKSSLILYKDKFDSLNKEQQDKVVTFLAKYRPIFNKICVDTVGDIFRNIERAYVAFGNKSDLDTFRNNMFNVLNKQLNDNDISNDLSSSMVSLFNSYARSIRNNRDMLITDKVSWCCSFYAPIVNRLSEKISSNKNLYVKYKQYYEKSPSMSMFPIMSNRSINQTIIGGARQPIKEKVVYVNNAEPIIKEKIVYVNGGDKDKNDTTTQYIKSIVDAQTEFNKSFEEIYRDLIKSVLIIDPTSKASTQSATLNNCVYALRSIEIDSPKTSYKISGFYPAKNWNKHYVSACYKVVQILEKEGRGIFDETIAIVKRLIELCENSARKAQDILSTYMTTSRTSSEVFYNIKHVGKIECRLSKEELNRYAENLRKLESSLLLITNETSLYSLDQQMKKYANDVQSRADLIREYFKNKSTQLRLNGSYAFNADRVEMLDQFNTQVKNCMLYINDKLDIKLATIRSKKDINVDNKMFDKFEKAMIMFKDVSNNQQLLKILERLHIVLFGEDFERKVDIDRRNKLSLELIQIIQKFWKESGYIDFIVQLYTEFNIFDDGFNWSEFRDNISLLLALVNITVSTKYNLECSLFDKDNKEIAVYQHPKEDTIVEILDLESLQNIAGKISGLEFKSTTDDTVYNFTNISTVQNAIITALQQMLNFANSSNEITGKTTSIPYNKKADPAVINGTMRIRLHGKRYSMSLVDKSKQTNSGEIQIAMLIFDAMLANVLDVVNKYTTIKYTGNFRLPLQISNLIRGGDNNQISTNFNVTDENGQIYGGNVFDILSVNDNNFDTVIIDAVPFYISAFNIIIFYYKKYGADIKNIDETNSDAINTSRLFFEVPKISPIYPLVSKLQSYKVDSLRKLNAQMIKCGIGIFNGYWRKAEGSTAAEKLSASLDMLLNEVNACMVYSSKLQFDALKVTGTLPNNFLQNLSSNINNLTDALKKSISESIIDLSMSRSQQTELYESMMKTALERVKSKGNSEEEKLAELINIIVKTDESHDSLNEVYKFIDLAVMPLFIALTGYSNIFSIYNIVINLEDASKDTDEISVLDLTKYILNIKCSTGLKEISVWECIQELNRLWTNERSIEKAIDFAAYKSALETSSIVTLWNSFTMFNNLYDIVNKGASYKVSNGFWFPSLPKTYPTNPIIRRIGDYSAISSNIKLILYQLYPYISGRNLYDYFISTCGDFASDVDHCLHLLLAYPNVNDKFIASVSNNVHKLIDDKQTLDERFNITQETIKVMQEIDMSSELGYVRPPPYKNNYYIPQYTEDNKVLQSMTVLNSGESMSTYTGSGVVPKFINVDGYAQNIVIQRFNQNVNLSADYSWTDWVIQRLADCDITFGCIPSKLIMKLQEYDPTRKKLRTLIYDTNPNVVQTFDMRNMTAYINPITSNIVTRSLSKSNVEKTKENGSISQQWISNLVGLIPYMINKIKAYYSHISGNVVYYDVNVKAELNALNASLVSFYNDIITFVPRIGFMENTNIFNNNKEYHAIAEIVPYLKTKNIENIASSELAKYSWANKYFFGSLSDLIFPEYKEYDRFEKIKEFAKNVFANSIFSNEFNTVIGILAKSMIASSIILGEQQTLNSSPIYMYYDTILKAINGSSELIIPIHEKFVNNVLKVLRNDIINEDNGGFVSALQGGNRIIGGTTPYITNLCKIIIPLLYTAVYGFIDIDKLIVLDNINDRNAIVKNIYDIAHFINILESAVLNEEIFMNNFENISIRFKNIFVAKSSAELGIVDTASITNIMALIKQLLIKAYSSDTYKESDAGEVINKVNQRLTGNNMIFNDENTTLAKTNAEKILKNHSNLSGQINSDDIIKEYGGIIGVNELLDTVNNRRGIPLPILVKESSSLYNISDNKINIVYRTLISGLLRFDNEFISLNREFRNRPSLKDAITKISQYLNSIPSYKIKARFNNIEAINVMSGSTRQKAKYEGRTKDDKLVFDIYHYLQNPADLSADQQNTLFDKLYVYKSAKPLNTRLLYNTTNYLSINNYDFDKREVPILNLLINSVYKPIDDYISAYYTKGDIDKSGKLTISGSITKANSEQRYKFIIGLLILLIYLSNRDESIEDINIKKFFVKDVTGEKGFDISGFTFTADNKTRIPANLPEAIVSWGKYIYNSVRDVSIINDKTYPLLVANAIYCALLNQSIDHVKIEYIIKSTIETNNNFVLLHETLKRIIGVIFVKSYLYSTETVFKSIVTSTKENNKSNNILNINDIGIYNINTGEVDKNSISTYSYNPTEIYTNIRNYVNEGITGYNNQPLLTYTQINLLFLDTSSITGVYNMLNPISDILTTSSLLLNNINTETMIYRGRFNKLIYAKHNNKNYLFNSSENGLSRLLSFETGIDKDFNNIIDTTTFLNNNTLEHNNDRLFAYEPILTIDKDTSFINSMNPFTFINSIGEGNSYYATYDFIHTCFTADNTETKFAIADYTKCLNDIKIYTISTNSDSYNTFKLINNNCTFSDEGSNPIILSKLILPIGIEKSNSQRIKLSEDVMCPYKKHSIKAITPKIKEDNLIESSAIVNGLFKDNNPVRIGLKIIESINESLTNTTKTYKNTGFASNVLQGGAVPEIRFNLLDNILKSDSEILGAITPTETYKNIYKLDQYTKSTLVSNLYTALFKYGSFDTLNVDGMFALIINYFHKYSVSFNSIYNQVIFPSILYNAAVYGTLAEHYSEVLKLHKGGEHTNAFTTFIQKYFNTIESLKNKQQSFFTKYFETVETGSDVTGRTQTSYKDMVNVFNENKDNCYKLANMPSINNNLLKLLYKHNFVKYKDNDEETKRIVNEFCGSSLISTLKRIDAVETFSFVILLLSKYMSYYNIDTSEDVPYSGTVGPNPFGFDSII